MDDHYVAQTYLESFVGSDGFIVPYYKGMRTVVGNRKSPKAVCFEVNGDTNKYFNNPRILEEYLPLFENPWKQNVEALRDLYIDGVVKYEISGYISFLRTCTPTAKRLGQERIRAATQPIAQNVLEQQFKLHPPRDEEIRQIIGMLVEQKQITTEIDRAFPHAIGISLLVSLTSSFLNGRWLIMINKSERPFITSDNPAVIYYHKDNAVIGQVYVPLAPDIAILVSPDDKIIDKNSINNSVCQNDCFATPKLEYVEKFNELIIKAAEKRVLHRAIDVWLEQTVHHCSDWHVEIKVEEIQTELGVVIATRELPLNDIGRGRVK
ncbi:MAG: DUF4238 domain-containing protein [Nitrospiraceae bacterium]|nr:MAG: DUF4238 domain-containing protein [Nitrospiraceae bacterium]